MHEDTRELIGVLVGLLPALVFVALVLWFAFVSHFDPGRARARGRTAARRAPARAPGEPGDE